MFELPFRWDISNQIYLGTLVEGERASAYKGFQAHLLPCCSRVLAFAGDCDLIFVGRSPESVFDHLSGLLYDTSWRQRLLLLQFSMRFNKEADIRREYPASVPAMRAYLEHLALHPQELIERTRRVALVDLVASGQTFGHLVHLLHNWSKEIHVDWDKVKRKIRLVGITRRTKNSPNTWRWQQHAAWLHLLDRGIVKNVSIPGELWDYLGNWQPKVTRSHIPKHWGNPENARPYYGKEQLLALRLAYDLFESGKSETRRAEFASQLTQETAMRESWFRSLVREVR